MNKNRVLLLQGAENVRELGGYKTLDDKVTKSCKVLRSSSLATLTEEDIYLLKEYGLKTIIDFRSTLEQIQAPDLVIEGITYISMPVFQEDSRNASAGSEAMIKRQLAENGDAKVMMQQLYKSFVTDAYSRSVYKDFFDLLLANDQEGDVLLYHCSAGKDRTGFATALFLSALGVDFETILKDYELTNQNLNKMKEKIPKLIATMNLPKQILDSIQQVILADASYLQAAFVAIEEEYENIEKFLREGLGLKENDLIKLHRLYIEK